LKIDVNVTKLVGDIVQVKVMQDLLEQYTWKELNQLIPKLRTHMELITVRTMDAVCDAPFGNDIMGVLLEISGETHNHTAVIPKGILWNIYS
jgi:hypothetical protein